MAAYLGYTLRMKTLFRGWPVMVNDTHTRRRRSPLQTLTVSLTLTIYQTLTVIYAYVMDRCYVICHVLQDVLKRLRLIDDRVINALNTSLPTESFKEKKNSEQQCKEFCDQVYFALYVFILYSVLIVVVISGLVWFNRPSYEYDVIKTYSVMASQMGGTGQSYADTPVG